METLVIYDEEEAYAHSLMEYISEKKGVPFKVIAFSRFDELEKYGKEKKIDWLLASEKAMSQVFQTMDVQKLILLSEGEMVSENQEIFNIYKYQSVEQILRELLNYYADMNKERGMPSILNGRSTEIIAVYSPVGRSGKTSFALTLGQILVDDGPTLYINMEEFSGFREILSKTYQCDLSDLMYHYMQSPESIGVKLKAVVNNLHGMDYVPPMIYSEDLRNVESECWKKMIFDIAAVGMYNSIVLDISSMMSNIFSILDSCDTIYMTLDNDRISMCKVNEFEQFLLKTEREEIINRTIKVMPPQIQKNTWNENYLEQLLWGEMGDFIRKIIRENVA